MSLNDPNSSGDGTRKDRHPTGVSILDEEIIRGIPKGSTIAVVGEPDSSSEMMLQSLAATGRTTEYVSTIRPSDSIMSDIKRISSEDTNIEENVSIRDLKNETDGFEDIIRKSVQRVDNGNLIVDTFSSHHKNPIDMRDLARTIYMKTEQNNGLSYIYFTTPSIEHLSREEWEILQMVDGIFNIKTEFVGSDQVENNLYINKLRGIDIPSEAQSLVYGDESVTIDVTSDIG